MLSELHSLNLKFCSKQYNKNFVLHLIVVPQLSSGWWQNFLTKTRQTGHANKQSKYYSLMSRVFAKQWMESIESVSQILAQNWLLSYCDNDIVSHGRGELPKLMSRQRENSVLKWQVSLCWHSVVQGHEISHFSELVWISFFVLYFVKCNKSELV